MMPSTSLRLFPDTLPGLERIREFLPEAERQRLLRPQERENLEAIRLRLEKHLVASIGYDANFLLPEIVSEMQESLTLACECVRWRARHSLWAMREQVKDCEKSLANPMSPAAMTDVLEILEYAKSQIEALQRLDPM